MQAAPSSSSADSAQPPQSERARPGLTSLPFDVLSEICCQADFRADDDDDDERWRVRDPTPTFNALRLCCKHLSIVLAERIAPLFEVVSIQVCDAGLDLLRALVRGPFAKRIRHVVLSPIPRFYDLSKEAPSDQLHYAEQMTLLGLEDPLAAIPGEREAPHGPETSLETLLTDRLASTFASLPGLQQATVGSGYLYVGLDPYARKHNGDRGRWVKDPFPLLNKRTSWYCSPRRPEDNDYETQVITAIFRSLLLALAHSRETAGYRIIDFKVDIGFLDESAYSFTAVQRDLLRPMLAELDLVHTRFKDDSNNHGELNTFIGMCTQLRYLRLSGDGSADSRLINAPRPHVGLLDGPERLQLEELELLQCTIHPAVLIKLLSQWCPRTVALQGVRLDKDSAFARNHRKKFYSWIGYPVLWDAVLRAVSANHGAERTEKLILDGAEELCSLEEKIRSVGFKRIGSKRSKYMAAPNYRGPEHITVLASSLEVAQVSRSVYDHGTHYDSGWTPLEGQPGDVFHRAVGLFNLPSNPFPEPPEQPTTKPMLALLPFEVLSFVCEHLEFKDILILRRCCKALAAVLIGIVGEELVTVPILPSGVAALAGIASSPFGPYVRHVVFWAGISTRSKPKRRGSPTEELVAQLEFLGLDEDSDWLLDRPSDDAPFAQALGPVLSALPGLTEITVGNLTVTKGYKKYPIRPRGEQTYTSYGDKRILNAVFRGVLFALAHTRERTVTTLSVAGYSYQGGPCGLDDSAFSLDPIERDLVTPFLNSLAVLRLSLQSYADNRKEQSWNKLHAFLRRCRNVTSLRLDGVVYVYRGDYDSASSFAVKKLVEKPFPLPRLVNLELHRFALRPSVIIKLLSQWPASEITLSKIMLRPDGDDNAKWDTLLVSLSSIERPRTEQLELRNLYLPPPVDSSQYNWKPYRVVGGRFHDISLTHNFKRDVFIRAAKRLKRPYLVKLDGWEAFADHVEDDVDDEPDESEDEDEEEEEEDAEDEDDDDEEEDDDDDDDEEEDDDDDEEEDDDEDEEEDDDDNDDEEDDDDDEEEEDDDDEEEAEDAEEEEEEDDG